MIKIHFYTFAKKINSTKQPTGTHTELDCNIKTPSSIINPVLEIATVSPIAFNYCYIPAFSRYYYIDDIEFNRGLWVISCSVDVLASYKSTIGNTTCYVTRSSSQYDGDIVDDLYPMKTNKTTHWLSPDVSAFSWSGFSSGVYVVGLQGDNNYSINGSVYYQMTSANFSTFLQNFYANSGVSWWGNLDKGVINSLNKINDFITSCRWYPTGFATDASNPQTIKVGGFNTNATGYIVKENPITTLTFTFNNLPKHPQSALRGNYLNAAPYSKYILRTGVTGSIPLDSFYMKGCTNLAVEFLVDVTTGQARTWVMADGTTFVDTYGQFGVDINLSGTEINVGGAISSTVKSLAQFAAGDYIGSVASVGNALGSMLPDVVGKASSGGYVQMYKPVELMIDFYHVTNQNNTYRGRPYCQLTTPATLTGFMTVDSPNIAINGTDTEANQINAYMTGGFFYE